MRRNSKRILFLTTLLAALVALSGCDKKQKKMKAVVAPVPVVVTKALLRQIDIKYRSVGSLVSREAPIIKSRVSGTVLKVVVQNGQAVKEGDLLAKVSDHHELIAVNEAEAKYIQAEAVYNERKVDAERKAKLAKDGIVSQSQYDKSVAQLKVAAASLRSANYSLIAAQNNLAYTNVVSPINGHVEKVLVSVGSVIQPSTPLFRLVNHQKLKAVLPYSQNKAHILKPGQRAHLISPVDPSKHLALKVTAVSPAINPKNRSLGVEIHFDNPGNWVAGASIHGHVFRANPMIAVVVPERSLVLRPQGLVVFTVKNKRAAENPVEVSYREDGYAAITKGLQAGDLVVTDGANYLDNGVPVEIKQRPSMS